MSGSQPPISGTPPDRLSGLDDVLAASRGLSVLDVGCHIGTVLNAFAAAGAGPLYGVDRYEGGLVLARTSVPGGTFAPYDLANSPGGIDTVLGLTVPIDVMLYLGVHQHVLRQVPQAVADALLLWVVRKGRKIFAARAPEPVLAIIHAAAIAEGLVPWYESRLNVDSGAVSPLRVYRR